jgi:ribosomal protein S12 methylthiotransferase accessory factor
MNFPETQVKKWTSGTHRTRDPAETLAAIQPLYARVGITRVADVTGLDHVGIPTVMAVRPNARSLSVSQGKGLTLDAAKASGAMEAIEQWHAERLECPLRLASAAELAESVELADVDRLPRALGRRDPHARLLWTEARDLWTDDPVWVPHEMVSLDLRFPLPEGGGHFLGGSNGLASGNDLAEAIAHGLWEVIERDSLTLFYGLPLHEQLARRLDLASVTDGACRDVLERYERAAIDVAVWNTTTDLQIASFLCAILDRRLDPFRPVGLARGSGCHPDRNVALARALTEAAQSRLTRIVGSRDDMQRSDFDRLRSEAEYLRHRGQIGVVDGPDTDFATVPTRVAPTFSEDLAWARANLLARGIARVAVVDLSMAKVPVRVVKVIVPGLEALADVPGYTPGERARAAGARS